MSLADYNKYIRFGTSTWTYEGWKGTIYNRPYTKANFKQTCLEEYAEYPLFGTVGIDHTFYGPANDDTLKRYASQLPDGFECCSKVWERITIPKYSKNKRYGKMAGEKNEDFLNAGLFIDGVLPPFARSFAGHTGPFIFQFQTQYPPKPKNPEDNPSVRLRKAFTEKLDSFLGKLPSDFMYSIEVRNRDFLTPDYFAMLSKHKVSHVFNHWTHMPSIGEQRSIEGSITDAGHLVARILTPLGTAYKQAVDKFFPYTKVQAPMERMRRDVADLAKEAINRKKKAYAIVNNRAEGNAPGTIEAIDAMIRSDIG